MRNPADKAKRQMLKRGLFGLALLPMGMGVLAPQVMASSLPRISVDHPQAKALNYVEVAADAAGHPKFAEGQYCDNCVLWIADVEGCRLVPGFSFEPKGWCNAWVG